MISLKVNDIQHNGDGTKTLFLDDSTTLESIPVALLNQWADPLEEGPILKKCMAARWKQASSDFSSSTEAVGKIFQYAPELPIGPWLTVAAF